MYVDDCIITGSSPTLVQHFITRLGHAFPIKDLGALQYFLGVKVRRTSSGMCLSQQKYIIDLLQKTNMHLAKLVSSPMAASLHLFTHDGPLFDDPTLYPSTMDSLQYLSFTRPDVSFAVNKACQFMHSLWDSH